MIQTIHMRMWIVLQNCHKKCGFTEIWEYICTCSSYGIIYMQCTKKNHQFMQIYSLVS